MIPAPLRKFVGELRKATDERDIEWKEGAPDSYFCDHKGYTLHFQYHFNGEIGESSYYFRIRQKDKDATFSVSDEEADFREMKDLWASVAVNASNFTGIADDFFD